MTKKKIPKEIKEDLLWDEIQHDVDLALQAREKDTEDEFVSVVFSREPLWLVCPEDDKEMLVEAYRNDIDHDFEVKVYEIPKALYQAYNQAEERFFEIKRRISRFLGLCEDDL